jgi:hypothetical protein
VEQTAKHSIEILNDALDLKTNLTQTIRGPIGQKLDFANHPYLCKGLNYSYSGNGFFNKFK